VPRQVWQVRTFNLTINVQRNGVSPEIGCHLILTPKDDRILLIIFIILFCYFLFIIRVKLVVIACDVCSYGIMREKVNEKVYFVDLMIFFKFWLPIIFKTISAARLMGRQSEIHYL